MRQADLRADQEVLARGAGNGQFQAARSASQSFPATTVTAVTLSWPTAFSDTNYTVISQVVDDDGAAQLISTSSPQKTAGGITVSVQNVDRSSSHLGHVEAIAVHD